MWQPVAKKLFMVDILPKECNSYFNLYFSVASRVETTGVFESTADPNYKTELRMFEAAHVSEVFRKRTESPQLLIDKLNTKFGKKQKCGYFRLRIEKKKPQILRVTYGRYFYDLNSGVFVFQGSLVAFCISSFEGDACFETFEGYTPYCVATKGFEIALGNFLPFKRRINDFDTNSNSVLLSVYANLAVPVLSKTTKLITDGLGAQK